MLKVFERVCSGWQMRLPVTDSHKEDNSNTYVIKVPTFNHHKHDCIKSVDIDKTEYFWLHISTPSVDYWYYLHESFFTEQ